MRSTSPPTWAMAAPIAFATAKCSGVTTRGAAAGRRGARCRRRRRRRASDRRTARSASTVSAPCPMLARAPSTRVAEDGPTCDAVPEVGAPGGDHEVARRQRLAAEDRAPSRSARSRPCRGPTLTSPPLGTSEPPPRPNENTSGMRKLVRTPPISTATSLAREALLQRRRYPVVVPPMSTTTPPARPERKAAPRIEFVGPLANVRTG